MVRNANCLRSNYRLCKQYIAEKVAYAINKNSPTVVNDLMENLKIGKGNSVDDIGFRMPFDVLQKHSGNIQGSLLNNMIRQNMNNSELNAQHLIIHLNKSDFINDMLKNDVTKVFQPHLQNSKPRIVEFSSPNIAKPFHVGHLRSTIIGNFISNLTDFLNGHVVRINYLGDWGPQFGYTILGLEQMKTNMSDTFTIESLHKAYILANQMAKQDSSIHKTAKSIFNDLECGKTTSNISHLWNEFRSITVKELEIVYKRLGIVFDEYDWESKYSTEKIQSVIKKLDEIGLLEFKEDGSTVINSNNQEITILKNDSSTLYLTRDIAAALRRHKHYNSEELYYVVDNTQSKHFYLLKSLIKQINSEINVHHIPFGRIHGMSSRKGEGVLLDQLLDQAKSTMKLKRKYSQTTKTNTLDDNEVSDVLGVSAIIINDLKQKRRKDYNFSWDSALQVNGDTGIKLQYTHCRLISLEEINSNITLPNEVIAECLTEPVAIDLILEICRFEDVLTETNQDLEACILVNYLFRLCNCINKALKILNVKNSDYVIAQHRILLFHRARNTLSSGMKILGLVPLKCM